MKRLEYVQGGALAGPDLGALEKKRKNGVGPAAYWHEYGAGAERAAACDPYASLLPVLAALLTQGNVGFAIETGGGDYTTPMLVATGIGVRTIETHPGWAARCGPWPADHFVFLCEPSLLREQPDLVLGHEAIRLSETDFDDTLLVIDHGPLESDRIPLLLCDTARHARWIVLHDAQDSAFADIDWGRWKFAVMVKNHLVWTAVLSDHADPMEVLGHLPGVTRA